MMAVLPPGDRAKKAVGWFHIA